MKNTVGTRNSFFSKKFSTITKTSFYTNYKINLTLFYKFWRKKGQAIEEFCSNHVKNKETNFNIENIHLCSLVFDQDENVEQKYSRTSVVDETDSTITIQNDGNQRPYTSYSTMVRFIFICILLLKVKVTFSNSFSMVCSSVLIVKWL